MTLPQLTEFIGWMTVLNFGILIVVGLMLIVLKPVVLSVHNKIFGLSETNLTRAYFRYLANYKILIFVFNVVPYVALKIMGH